MNITEFRISFRAVVTTLYAGVITYGQAYARASKIISEALRSAFYAGFVKAGIYPSEITPEEHNKINDYIYTQIDFLPGYLNAIQSHASSKAGLISRLELWINRYREAINLGFLWAEGDPKVIWVLGPTSDHCSSCSRAAGKVKRKSQFEAIGLIPQSTNLECGGFRCKCSLEKTDEPMSMGPLPRP